MKFSCALLHVLSLLAIHVLNMTNWWQRFSSTSRRKKERRRIYKLLCRRLNERIVQVNCFVVCLFLIQSKPDPLRNSEFPAFCCRAVVTAAYNHIVKIVRNVEMLSLLSKWLQKSLVSPHAVFLYFRERERYSQRSHREWFCGKAIILSLLLRGRCIISFKYALNTCNSCWGSQMCVKPLRGLFQYEFDDIYNSTSMPLTLFHIMRFKTFLQLFHHLQMPTNISPISGWASKC